MRDIYKLLVFTPSYNRAHTLERCYNSIVEQNYDDMTWLVVDDGSTDETCNLINRLKSENKINIEYHYQDNAGKQGAWNYAVKFAQDFDLFLCVDSDDVMYAGALKNIEKYFTYLKSEDVIGLRCLAIRNSTLLADSKYSNDLIFKASWFDELISKNLGERVDVFKPQILIQYLFPVTEEIKFVPESWFYCKSAMKYKFIYLSIPVTLFYDEHTHLRLSKSGIKKHAKGQQIARGALLRHVPMKVWRANPTLAFKTLLRYLQSYCYAFLARD